MNHEDKEPLYSDSESDNEVDENEEEEDQEEPEEEEQEEPEEDDADEEKSVADEDDDEEDADNDDGSDNEYATKTIPQLGGSKEDDDDEDDDDDDNSPYLQKFNAEINKNYIVDFHPECTINNYDEINALTFVVRDKNNNVVDEIHKTIPFLTKYERTRIIGQRAKQINSGAKAFVKVPENVIDGYLIAELELAQKRIPFIIRRPLPGGGCEYWNLKDLEIVSY
jgi:DNA-directed RNA polymerase I, II, and III subunit RPABC2